MSGFFNRPSAGGSITNTVIVQNQPVTDDAAGIYLIDFVVPANSLIANGGAIFFYCGTTTTVTNPAFQDYAIDVEIFPNSDPLPTNGPYSFNFTWPFGAIVGTEGFAIQLAYVITFDGTDTKVGGQFNFVTGAVFASGGIDIPYNLTYTGLSTVDWTVENRIVARLFETIAAPPGPYLVPAGVTVPASTLNGLALLVST